MISRECEGGKISCVRERDSCRRCLRDIFYVPHKKVVCKALLRGKMARRQISVDQVFVFFPGLVFLFCAAGSISRERNNSAQVPHFMLPSVWLFGETVWC